MNGPEFDSDGYPTDGTLETIEHWSHLNPQGLFQYIIAAWNWKKYAHMHGRYVCLSTGGWSGNESLIEAFNKNYVLWSLCWVLSRRGGYYKFEIPKNFYKREKS